MFFHGYYSPTPLPIRIFSFSPMNLLSTIEYKTNRQQCYVPPSENDSWRHAFGWRKIMGICYWYFSKRQQRHSLLVGWSFFFKTAFLRHHKSDAFLQLIFSFFFLICTNLIEKLHSFNDFFEIVITLKFCIGIRLNLYSSSDVGRVSHSLAAAVLEQKGIPSLEKQM